MFVLEYFGSQINHKFYTFLNVCVFFLLKNLHICENGRLCETVRLKMGENFAF